MFTGIVEAVGVVSQLLPMNDDMRIQVNVGKLSLSDVKLGDSIAVNGVCLTVIKLTDTCFFADISKESLDCSTLKYFKAGQKVNLEKALTPTTRLGGHLVSGHVDGTAEVVEKYPVGRSTFYKLKSPNELAKYIAAKGSITVDGTSLTVNKVSGCYFDLNIIPQTLSETILNHYEVGTIVNLEVDLLARYIERLLLGNRAVETTGSRHSNITDSFLAEHGFK